MIDPPCNYRAGKSWNIKKKQDRKIKHDNRQMQEGIYKEKPIKIYSILYRMWIIKIKAQPNAFG